MGAPTTVTWLQLSAHLDRLLDLPVEEREPYVAAMEQQDPALAAQLRRLLAGAAGESFQDFMRDAAPEILAAQTVASLIGRAVGPYVIEAELGHGGMGSVWLAHRADGRYQGQVAIKFIHTALLGRHGEQRFQLEGQLLARLRHPAIATLLDAGVLDGNQPYLVLEYVAGEAIDAWCEHRALGREARIRLFIDVLAAVAHAHSHLVVHRDIKPSNVLVNEQGEVKLLDFGIAKLMEGEAALTQSQGRALTPQYAAPEQINGQPVTTATDVYALGLMLYLLLTGAHPLAATTASRTLPTGAELYRKVLTEDAPRLSAATHLSSSLRRYLRGDLENIVARALKKNPDERYGTVAAFAEDLRHFLAHEPVQARADSVAYRMARFTRRHRGAVLAGALTTMGLIATSTFALLQMNEARAQRDQARAELRRAEAANDFSSLMLEQVGESGRMMSREQLVESGVQLLEAREGGDNGFVADMLVQLANRYAEADQPDRALALDLRAVEKARGAANPMLLAMTLCEAVAMDDLSQPHVQAWLQEARTLMAASKPVPLRTAVSCAMAESWMLAQANQGAAAIAVLQAAHERQAAEGVRTGLYYSWVLSDQSALLSQQGRHAEAYRAIVEAGAAHDRGGRSSTTGRRVIRGNTATTLAYLGEPQASLLELEASRKTPDGLLPMKDIPVAMRCVWAWTLRRLGRAQEALELVTGAGETLIADGSVQLGAYALMHEAAARADLQDLAGARVVAQRALDVLAKDATDQSGLAQVHGLLAQIDVRDGKAAAARTRIETFLHSTGYPAAPPSPILEPALEGAALTALADNDPRAAESFARQALALAEATARGSESSADVGEMLMLLADLRLRERQPEAAASLLQRAIRCFDHALGEEAPRTREARARLAAISGVEARRIETTL